MRCAVGVLLWLTAGAMASFTALAAAPAATEADTALHAPYDGNHWAVLARAQIQARYLPAGLSDSILAKSSTSVRSKSLVRCTTGVFPTVFEMDSWMGGRRFTSQIYRPLHLRRTPVRL